VVIDVLVLNAGIVPSSARPTAQGLELMFGVNYLANVALVERMLELGVLRPDPNRRPRIVFVSSESHRGNGPIDIERLGRFTPYGAMGSMKVYGQSKFLLTAYAMTLAQRLGGAASVHACCPGPIDSDIAREAPAWIKPLLALLMRRFFRSPADASAPVVHLACARALDERTGTYLHLMNEKRADDACMDLPAGERLLHASGELVERLLREDTRKVA
jgi:NAD(P)-dependent dehydrogenase (short-subunit alcohol dehydrogenase family)